ncbi:MAG: hypothetical protein IPG81_12580, partial [Sandaracinaceae bacterium]|nr:hypothetical protein [Sandaracinaceae bacterium]
QSFALWWVSEYEAALAPLAVLLTLDPDDPYAVLFRGSTRLFVGTDVAGGTSDLTRALELDAANPHAHFVVADAYTYALPDLALALAEAEMAIALGLDTLGCRPSWPPRISRWATPSWRGSTLRSTSNSGPPSGWTRSPCRPGRRSCSASCQDAPSSSRSR